MRSSADANFGPTEWYKAQFGEDRLLDQFFAHKTCGFYLEIGAFDGENMSNTYFFERRGWTGILVEADPSLAQQCRERRPRSIVVNCAATARHMPERVDFDVVVNDRGLSSLNLDSRGLQRVEQWTGGRDINRIRVPARTVDDILKEQGVRQIDFVTIDVEGHEWNVLDGFDLSQWKPSVILIERNRELPDPRIMHYLHRHGYRFVRTTGVNDWFRVSSSNPGWLYHCKLGVVYYLPKLIRGTYHRLRKLYLRSHRHFHRPLGTQSAM